MKQLTQDQKEWMLKAILNSKDLIIFQHEEESLSMMYWKYATNKDIDEQELSDDLKYLDNLAK
jgi:hypothetical protein